MFKVHDVKSVPYVANSATSYLLCSGCFVDGQEELFNMNLLLKLDDDSYCFYKITKLIMEYAADGRAYLIVGTTADILIFRRLFF